MHWILRRVGQAVFTFWAVVTLTFGLVRFLPGGPIDYIKAQVMATGGTGQTGQMMRIQRMAKVYTNINPEKPIYVQYYSYVSSVLQGDLGTSMTTRRPVGEMLASALPWTTFLMSISLLLTFSIGVALGAVIAYKEGSRLDVFTSSVIVWLNGVPYYVAALFMLFLLGYQWELFPVGGLYGQQVRNQVGLNVPFVMSVLYHAALPIMSVVITEFGGWALAMRGNSISTLGSDYIRVARLRGLPDNRIALRYVGRNSILPMYTGLMIAIGFLFGGSVILERIFQYPGIGFYMVQGLNARDYPLVMGGFLIITIAVVIGVFIADLTYGLLDPRVRTEGES